MNKTNKVEITKDMSIVQQVRRETHNEMVDVLQELECFSRYTPSMKPDDDTYQTRVMLEVPTSVVQNAIRICEEVNAKYKEMTGEDNYGITPFYVLADALENTDVMHYPNEVLKKELEEMEGVVIDNNLGGVSNLKVISNL